MFRKIPVLLFLLASINVNAQFQKATILLKNNTSKEGFLKVRSHDGINFKEKEGDKPVVYNHLQVLGFNVGEAKYRYVKRNTADNEPRILREMIYGTIILYAIETQGGEGYMTFGPGGNLPPVLVSRKPSISYYMLKNEKLIKIGKKIRNRHLKKLKDCPVLVAKIKNEEIHRTNIITAIEFYNQNCGTIAVKEK
jgi:hypothetical protein